MESLTYQKNIKESPKKLRFLLDAVIKLSPIKAMDYLMYTPKKSARVLYQSLKSAISNAKNTLKTSENLLKFKLLTIEEGNKLKRYRHGGRGTAKPIRRRLSHIKIILVADQSKISTAVIPNAVNNKEKINFSF